LPLSSRILVIRSRIPPFFRKSSLSDCNCFLPKAPFTEHQTVTKYKHYIPISQNYNLQPIGLFYLFKLVFGVVGAYTGLGALGLIGILFHSVVLDFFAKKYLKQKHQLIKNYKNS
jgi:hypothetical protein